MREDLIVPLEEIQDDLAALRAEGWEADGLISSARHLLVVKTGGRRDSCS